MQMFRHSASPYLNRALQSTVPAQAGSWQRRAFGFPQPENSGTRRTTKDIMIWVNDVCSGAWHGSTPNHAIVTFLRHIASI
jgi:hypothetical protein